MPERHRYDEIAALVSAIGSPWFGRTLQGVLQSLFHYDHFLLARYRKGKELSVLSHDLGGVEAQRAVRWLETENYVVEPVFRLYAAGKLAGGVHDMQDLTLRERALEPPAINLDRLPHLVADPDEEIGWRTMDWPRNQQETCVLVETGPQTLLAISLYNMGMERNDRSSERLLRALHPILTAVLVQHAATPAGRAAPHSDATQKQEPGDEALASRPADAADVTRFLVEQFEVEPTTRELEVFRRLLNGATPSLIARDLAISIATVRTHRRNVYRRIGNARLPELMNAFFEFVSPMRTEYPAPQATKVSLDSN